MNRLLFVFCLVAGIASAQIVPMTNDNCGTAITVLDGVNPSAPAGLSGNYFTNTGSTNSTGPAQCVAWGSDVWFSYVATATGVTTFSLCTPAGFVAGSNVDSVIQVLDGSTCPPTIALNCDDDTCGPGAGVQARVNTCTTLGSTYFVRVSTWNNTLASIGTFYLTISAGPAPVVANDDCAGATPLAYGLNGPLSNTGAVDGCVQTECGLATGSQGFRDVWYSIAATCSGPLIVATDCNGVDTQLTAHAACGGPAIACNDDFIGCGFGASLSFYATQGNTYYIRMASFANVALTFNITVSAGPMGTQFTSPFGPGSIQIDIGGGPLGGQYFFAVTLAAGSFPNGWFYGLDVTIPELANLINLGFPFVGPLDPTCGSFSIGPVGGVPPITVYSVTFGFPAGIPVPSAIAAPLSYTVP